jgi:hypothetical protein
MPLAEMVTDFFDFLKSKSKVPPPLPFVRAHCSRWRAPVGRRRHGTAGVMCSAPIELSCTPPPSPFPVLTGQVSSLPSYSVDTPRPSREV